MSSAVAKDVAGWLSVNNVTERSSFDEESGFSMLVSVGPAAEQERLGS